jgi:hypothetical protein
VDQLSHANTARQANRLPRWFFGRQIAIGLVALQQVMAAFAADSAFDEAIALRATLRSQGNFSFRTGADDHFNSFLEQFWLGPGSNERGKLAEGPIILKRLATTLPGRLSTMRERVAMTSNHSLARRAGVSRPLPTVVARGLCNKICDLVDRPKPIPTIRSLCSRRLMDLSH